MYGHTATKATPYDSRAYVQEGLHPWPDDM